MSIYVCFLIVNLYSSKTLFIQDIDKQPVAVLIPNMVDNLPHLLKSVVAQLQSTCLKIMKTLDVMATALCLGTVIIGTNTKKE